MRHLYLLAALICFLRPVAKAEDNCQALLANGVFDTKLNVDSSKGFNSFRTLMCSHAVKSSSAGGGLSLELPIKGIPVKGDANYDQFSSDLNDMCQGTASLNSFSQNTVQFVREASKTLVDGFNQCMGAGSGFRSTVVYSDVPGTFHVALAFRGFLEGEVAKIESVKYAPSGTHCPSLVRGMHISSQIRYYDCTRKDDTKATDITLVVKLGPGVVLRVEALKPVVLSTEPANVIGRVTMVDENTHLATGTLLIDQQGREVYWHGKDANYHYDFSGKFDAKDPNKFSGIEVRKTLSNGCDVNLYLAVTVDQADKNAMHVHQVLADQQNPGIAQAQYCGLSGYHGSDGIWEIER